MGARVEPVLEADLDRVATFLHTSLNPYVSVADWRRSFDISRRFSPPNNGMMLVDGDDVVGVYAAYYSDRQIDGRTERFCNLGAWCVLPAHRLQAVRLLKGIVGQPGYHFSDLSPSGNVIPLNRRLGFEFLESGSVLVPTLPWAWRRGSVTSDPATLAATLTGRDEVLYADHAGASAARHVLLRHASGSSYVVFRMDRRTKLTGMVASILHVSDREVFRKMLLPFLGHLLVRHGAVAMLAELRIVGDRPRASLMLSSFRRKMYKSSTLEPSQIDYFYSELVAVPW